MPLLVLLLLLHPQRPPGGKAPPRRLERHGLPHRRFFGPIAGEPHPTGPLPAWRQNEIHVFRRRGWYVHSPRCASRQEILSPPPET